MTGKNIKKSWNLEEVLNANLNYDGKYFWSYQKIMITFWNVTPRLTRLNSEHLQICLACLVTLIIQLLYLSILFILWLINLHI